MLFTSYQLRALQIDDLTAVYAIENAIMPDPAKAGTYEYELQENQMAHYHALTHANTLIGYGGYWIIADELHVSIVGVHPQWRGRGLGEWLLLTQLQQASTHQAILATLEVRASNVVAQSLYRKYQFEEVGRRKRYYANKEDALLMTVYFTHDYQQFLQKQGQALETRLVASARSA